MESIISAISCVWYRKRLSKASEGNFVFTLRRLQITCIQFRAKTVCDHYKIPSEAFCERS